jgi:hypothetical protein
MRARAHILRITGAAIVVNGVVWSLPAPARHCHLIRAWCDAHWTDGKPAFIGSHEQGFVTSAGNFVTREEAAELAYCAGQITERKPTLFSEDVW